MHNLDLKSLEKKAYTSYFQDGIIDFFVGVSFCLYGLVLVFEKHPVIGLTFLPILFIRPMKKRYTVARMGQVQFSEERHHKISRTALVAFGLGMGVFALMLFFSKEAGLENYRLFLLGFTIAFLPLMGALLTGVSRYLFYAPLLSLTFILERFIPGSYPYNFITLGIIMSGIGSVLFIKFIQKYSHTDSGVA